MIILDTSALIRFFTKDDEKKAQRVKSLLESQNELCLTEAVLMELTFTLLKFYQVPKPEVIKILKFLLSVSNIQVSQYMRVAVQIFEDKNLSITNCLVVAYSEGNELASFDKNLMKVAGVKSVL